MDLAGPHGGDEELQHHEHANESVSRQPIIPGGHVKLLANGAEAFDAIYDAIDSARERLYLEYYEFEDVHWRGRRVVDLLIERLEAGVEVALSYDGAGSQDTDDALFDQLRRAGAKLLEFHPFSPLYKRFNPLTLNDRDHRKILVADRRVAIVGGVNLSRVYENPRSAGAPSDPAKAFWYDVAAQIEGPPVDAVAQLFLDNWRRQGGEPLATGSGPHRRASAPDTGGELLRIDGSAPRQHRQLYFESLKAAVSASRSHILLATGYFVPTHQQWRLLTKAAERGVTVDLVLAGYSDVPSCTRAARALYGRMLASGIRIHEMNDGVLHAKVSTIDGVWTAIGSSNLDRRSFVYNNEVDAIILGRNTASQVEAVLRSWLADATPITIEAWRNRSFHERAGELLTRFWSRYM